MFAGLRSRWITPASCDNLFGRASNLYIEDPVEEAQVLTTGISAEYGRFSGGVVNVQPGCSC